MSSRLTSESRIYADKARDLNRQVSLIRLMHIINMRIIQLNSLILMSILGCTTETAICLVHRYACEAMFV